MGNVSNVNVYDIPLTSDRIFRPVSISYINFLQRVLCLVSAHNILYIFKLFLKMVLKTF